MANHTDEKQRIAEEQRIANSEKRTADEQRIANERRAAEAKNSAEGRVGDATHAAHAGEKNPSHTVHRPEGVAVPPIPANRADLSEAEKTLARQQAVAGDVGDRTPADFAIEKAREISMTDKPNLEQVEQSKEAGPVLDPATGKPAVDSLK